MRDFGATIEVMFMKGNADKHYKSNDSALLKEIRADLEKNAEKFRDPVILGEMMYKLLEERENTNRILKNILAKLDAMSGQEAPKPKEVWLPEIDEQIVTFVRENRKVTAEEVRKKFRYRGKNAASARLNKLCTMNVLQKKQVGKKVFFFPR